MNRPTFTVLLKHGYQVASTTPDVRPMSTKETRPQFSDLPTKPPSSFMMYVEEERKKLVKRGFSMADGTHEAAKKWQTLPPSKKKVYDDKRTKAMLKYEASLEKINKRNEKKIFISHGLSSKYPRMHIFGGRIEQYLKPMRRFGVVVLLIRLLKNMYIMKQAKSTLVTKD